MKNLTIDIWEGLSYTGTRPEFRPDLRTYILDEGLVKDRPRPAVLVIPGGGYGGFGGGEQECVAMQFASAGYHTFILRYTVVGPNLHPQPLLDLSRALCIIREHAAEWRVDADKIAILGFSAGGHLCASYGTLWNRDFLQLPGMQSEQNKPNAMVLCYPVITSGEFTHEPSMINLIGEHPSDELRQLVSPELQVTEATPPAFIWHTFADSTVPAENALLMASALRKANIPFELHIYPEGPHAMSIGTAEGTIHAPDPHIATWVPLCRDWLKLQFGV